MEKDHPACGYAKRDDLRFRTLVGVTDELSVWVTVHIHPHLGAFWKHVFDVRGTSIRSGTHLPLAVLDVQDRLTDAWITPQEGRCMSLDVIEVLLGPSRKIGNQM